VVAGGSGRKVTTRQTALLSWVPTVTVAVIAPESVSEPDGVIDPARGPTLAVGAVPAPQPVDVIMSAKSVSGASTAAGRMAVSIPSPHDTVGSWITLARERFIDFDRTRPYPFREG
jgi:hypothetical protein